MIPHHSEPTTAHAADSHHFGVLTPECKEKGVTGGGNPPSDWVARFASLIPPGGPVLDVACGGGRHLRWLAARGLPVTGIDRDVGGVADLTGRAGVEIIAADLENGRPWPLPPDRRFAAVVVTNYLHRPLLPALAHAVADGGVLIYETFASGNGAFGRPGNPDFLLQPGELWHAATTAGLLVLAYEHGVTDSPRPAAVQRICAIRAAAIPPPRLPPPNGRVIDGA